MIERTDNGAFNTRETPEITDVSNWYYDSDTEPLVGVPPPDYTPEERDALRVTVYEKLIPETVPREVTTDVAGAIQRCVTSNYWSVIGAMDGYAQRVHLHTLDVLEEDDEQVTKVAWGGRAHSSVGELSDVNEWMVQHLVKALRADVQQVTELPTFIIPGEDRSTTEVEILRYPIAVGWTIDVVVTTRTPLSAEEQRSRMARFANTNRSTLPVERPASYLDVWVCPPNRGIDTLFTISEKDDALGVVEKNEADIVSTQPMRGVNLAKDKPEHS